MQMHPAYPGKSNEKFYLPHQLLLGPLWGPSKLYYLFTGIDLRSLLEVCLDWAGDFRFEICYCHQDLPRSVLIYPQSPAELSVTNLWGPATHGPPV